MTIKSMKRKEVIVEIAKQHFATLGYDNATLRDIAIDAKVTPSSLAYYFSSKEFLLDRTLRAAVCNYSARIVQIACSRGTAGERLTKMAETYFTFLRDDGDVHRILEQEATHLATRPMFDYLALAQSDVDDAWGDILTEILTDSPSLWSNYRARTGRRIVDAFDIMAHVDGTDCDQRTKVYFRNKLIEQVASILSTHVRDMRCPATDSR